MAIIQNRLSTTPVPNIYFTPDNILYGPLVSYEAGPIALDDPSEGQQYQDWVLTYLDSNFILTPLTIGSSSIILSITGVIKFGLAFDQNGHPAICYNTVTNGYLYWFDSAIPGFVTTNFGTGVHSLALTLDDKRNRQTQANDIILWYTKVGATNYDLFNRVQRERFTIETLMESDIPKYILQSGMHEGYRVQITLASSQIVPPVLPLGPFDEQINLDFEFGDIYWTKTNDFLINQSNPFAGNWSAILDTNLANYSTLENNVYTVVILGNFIPINCRVKGSIITSIKLGFKFYNGAKALILTDTVSKSVSLVWTRIVHAILIPNDAVYYRIFVESDATDGIVSLDNFSTIDLSNIYEISLDSITDYSIELDNIELFEIKI